MVVTMQVTALRIAPVMVVMVLMAIIAVVMVITITRSARHRLRLRSTVGAFLVAAMRSLLDRSELITQTGDALSQGNEITMGRMANRQGSRGDGDRDFFHARNPAHGRVDLRRT